MIRWDEQWAEVLVVIFIALGFVISILLTSPLLTYISVILAGFLAARIYYAKRYRQPILPFVLMIVGFMVGYWAGSFWADRLVTLIFFILGFGCSYYLHMKNILVIFKSENFIK